MKYSDFKKMDFYHAFEDWLYSEISGDFYSPPLYSDDGDLLKDAEFDEDGCDRAACPARSSAFHSARRFPEE